MFVRQNSGLLTSGVCFPSAAELAGRRWLCIPTATCCAGTCRRLEETVPGEIGCDVVGTRNQVDCITAFVFITVSDSSIVFSAYLLITPDFHCSFFVYQLPTGITFPTT